MTAQTEWTIYHNPRCSKSRAALAKLRENGIEPQVIEYLKTPPDAATLDALLRKMGFEPRDILRSGEDEYAALGLANPDLSREQLIAAMVEHPILIQRPIVVRGDRVVLGRPTEAIDALLDE